MGWESYEKEPNTINTKRDSLCNVNIHFKFNSEEVRSMSEGQYCNGVVVEFDGQYLIRHLGKNDSLIDRTLVSVFSSTPFNSYKIMADMGQKEYHLRPFMNSVTEKVSRIDTVEIMNNDFEGKPNKEQYCMDIVSNDTLKAYITYGGGIKDDTLKKYRYKIAFLSNGIGVKEENPYYYYSIAFPFVKFAGNLFVSFDFADIQQSMKVSHDIEKTMQFEQIFPEPDVISKGKIEYYSEEKKMAILRNHGIIIQAVDIEALNHQKRVNYTYSTLVGIGVPLVLELIIQLICKLRRLNRKEEM